LDFDELSLLTFYKSDVTVVLLTFKVLAISRMPEPLLAIRYTRRTLHYCITTFVYCSRYDRYDVSQCPHTSGTQVVFPHGVTPKLLFRSVMGEFNVDVPPPAYQKVKEEVVVRKINDNY
jgi:hypothetical protein